MDVKNQKFFVLGVSKSGAAVADYVLSRGGKCFLYEELESEKITKTLERLKNSGGVIVDGSCVDAALSETDVLVISPGVPINHRVAVKAKESGVKIIGELEFGYRSFLPVIIAVSGTNGKTTTVSMIESGLKKAGISAPAVGNIGVPLTEKSCDIHRSDYVVCEVSSFQLESVDSFTPHIACVLNIAPDHLERHYTMENYVFLKKRILRNMRESEYAILNYDDETVKSFSNGAKCKILYVSVKEKVDGAYRSDGKLYYKDEYVMEESALSVRGEHNVYDALFALAALKICGVKTETVKAALSEFRGVKHRIELVAESSGVKYFDDSKATNVASALTAAKSMTSPTVIILGGSEKGETYEELFEKLKESKVYHAVITGASRFNMMKDAEKSGFTDYTVTGDFKRAVSIAKLIAKNGDNVLLSPACASFDSFNNYEERGNAFVKAVGTGDDE